jgi:hypothetical protein
MIKYNTRTELLSLVPKHSKFVEIGVFKGDFANEIFHIVNPDELYLVDIWEGGFGSGDKNGNNHIHIDNMERLYLEIYQQTKNIDNIHVIRSKSVSFLKSCSENYFDAIYIDGDHTAQAVYDDLVESFRVIKSGGLIMGHDYHYTLGGEVVYAVNKFCETFEQSVECIADDGCPSFMIKVNK